MNNSNTTTQDFSILGDFNSRRARTPMALKWRKFVEYEFVLFLVRSLMENLAKIEKFASFVRQCLNFAQCLSPKGL